MTGPGGRPSPGDPRVRVLLVLLVGGALIYASFNRGQSHAATERAVSQAVVRDESAATNSAALLTGVHRQELVLAQRAPIVITAPIAVKVADLADPGNFTCDVGLSVANTSAQDIDDLEFGIRYTGADRPGSTVHRLTIGAFANQTVTPVAATPGGCRGLAGAVSVYRCSFADGTDCGPHVMVRPEGPVALTRAP